jgi:hypothetical protein
MGALGRLLAIAVLPTAVTGAVVGLPRVLRALRDRLRRRSRVATGPLGPPLERTAADLRRLLAEHAAVRTSPRVPSRVARLRALEAAISDAAVDAARAVDVPVPVRAGRAPLAEPQLSELLGALTAAGLVLPGAPLDRT